MVLMRIYKRFLVFQWCRKQYLTRSQKSCQFLSLWSVTITAWKVSVFGVFLVRIFLHSEWVRTRKTPNMDTFYAVKFWSYKTFWSRLHQCLLRTFFTLTLKFYQRINGPFSDPQVFSYPKSEKFITHCGFKS